MKNDIRPRRIIGLTGFMGSGKSTVARLLARQIGWQYVDLDKLIAEATGATIPEIFAKLGEPAFRKIEHEQLAKTVREALALQKPRIISLGGGTTAQPDNVALLRESGAALVWLHCPVEELLSRCAHITNRPLFRDEASFRRLYQERLPSYEMSDFRVETNIEPLRVVEQILALGIFPKVTA
jgi:shikimate kinase